MTGQIVPILADERLEHISDTAVATGCVKKGDGQRHQRQLKRQADRKRPASVQDLSQVGITVVKG